MFYMWIRYTVLIWGELDAFVEVVSTQSLCIEWVERANVAQVVIKCQKEMDVTVKG